MRLTATAGLGLTLVGVLAPLPAAAAPRDGFTEAQLSRTYDSDATTSTGDRSNPDPANWAIARMDVFNTLRTDGAYAATGNAEVMAYNDRLTSEINLGASDEQHQRAIVDQYEDMSVSMADGLGTNLGAIYAEAMAAGELPKTQALLAKNGGMIGRAASSNPPKEFFDYDRPYLRMDVEGDDAALVLVDKEGGDAWASTSGAFPSGHTSQAQWQGTALAYMLPELSTPILARTAEASNNRIVIGAHYPLDVISGRMMGQGIVALRLADDDFRALMDEASVELHEVLETGCGDTLVACIAADTPYMEHAEALAFFEDTLSYGFPLTGPRGADFVVPAGAETLLLASHPELDDAQRRQVLALTAIDSGHPLDAGEEEGWQRLNLAAAMAAEVTVDADGDVSLVDSSAPTFTDIATNPFATEIAWLAQAGISTGWRVGDTVEFRPLWNVKRDQMAAFLYRLAGSPAFTAPAESPFADVATSDPFYAEIAWLESTGITTGWTVGDTVEFRPLWNVKRDQMAAFLYRFAQEFAAQPARLAASEARFSDVDADTVFHDEIMWLASVGIAEGWEGEDGTEFRPLTTVKRDQMAAFLSRYAGALA